jgi:hypothetical protein
MELSYLLEYPINFRIPAIFNGNLIPAIFNGTFGFAEISNRTV